MLAGGVRASTVSGPPALRILASTSICQKDVSPTRTASYCERRRVAKDTLSQRVLCKRAKGYRPLFRFSRPEVCPSFLFLTPSKTRGMARHKAHGLDCARPARERVTPGRARNAGLWA